jgi:hypothetical protein
MTSSNEKTKSKAETVLSEEDEIIVEEVPKHKVNVLRLPNNVKNRLYSTELGFMNRFVIEKTIKRQEKFEKGTDLAYHINTYVPEQIRGPDI